MGTSIAVTVAPFTITLVPTLKASGWPLTAVALMQSVTSAAGTAPAST